MNDKYKADPIKQYMICRGCANDRAVELCVAGKIELSQIPDYTDRLTVVRMGQLEIDPQVTAEVMRLAARIQQRALDRAEKQPEPVVQGDTIICPTCVHLDSCPYPGAATECDNYENRELIEMHAVSERLREQEEQERQAAEGEAADTTPSDEPVQYKCGSCDKTYKTLKGLENHSKKCGGK